MSIVSALQLEESLDSHRYCVRSPVDCLCAVDTGCITGEELWCCGTTQFAQRMDLSPEVSKFNELTVARMSIYIPQQSNLPNARFLRDINFRASFACSRGEAAK